MFEWQVTKIGQKLAPDQLGRLMSLQVCWNRLRKSKLSLSHESTQSENDNRATTQELLLGAYHWKTRNFIYNTKKIQGLYSPIFLQSNFIGVIVFVILFIGWRSTCGLFLPIAFIHGFNMNLEKEDIVI